MKSHIIFIITFLLLISSCKFTKIRKASLREKYEAAINYYEKEKYYKAALLLEEVIPYIKGTRESEKAQFMYAYCQYYQKQYTLSAYYFERFYETFQGSPKIQEARYRQIKSLYNDSPPSNLDQTSTYEAINTAQSFLNAYPNSEYFEEASKILNELRGKLEVKSYDNANLYYKTKDYRAASIAFKNFEKDFPDSDLNEQAMFKRLDSQFKYANQSTFRKKQERMNEAVKLYEFFVVNYPNSKSKKDADKIYKDIQAALSKLRNQT